MEASPYSTHSMPVCALARNRRPLRLLKTIASGNRTLSRILAELLGGTRKGPPEGYPAEGPDRAFDKPNSARCAAIAPLRLFAKLSCRTGGKRLTKPPKWGIVKTQRVLPVGRLPLHHREVTVILEEWRLLLFAILENQTNDSQNDHAELKQFTP